MWLWRTPRTRALLLTATIALVVGIVALVAHVYVDVLWFREVGQERVYWTALAWKILAPATVGVGTASFVLANLALVRRRTRGAAAPDRPAAVLLWRYGRFLYPPAAIVCGWISVQSRPSDMWTLLALWANRSPFGVEDPLFHRDVGFFVFSLPLYEEVARWLLQTLLMAGVAIVAAYAAAASIRAARAHLIGLGALLLLVLAWRLRLDQLGLVLPHGNGPVPGASYTDVKARMPALRVLIGLALAGVGVCAVGAVRRVRPAVAVVLVGVAGLTVAAASALPQLIERFGVAPQALSRERPYVDHAITATRRAFELDRIEVRALSGSRRLSASAVARSRGTLENVPLWDARVLRPAMNELQAIGGYYGFPSTTVDRYEVGGVKRLMTVAARQLDLSRLRSRARSWTNERFAYTHGYGVAAVIGGEADASRSPRFAQGEFLSARNPLRLKQPRIYFGERSARAPPYLVLNSGRGEVEEPIPGSRAPAYRYDGPGGIRLANPLKRAALAARFQDFKLLITETATDRSRIVLHQDVRERVQMLAPFLRWDAHPQTVVAGGRVQFLLHGYTTSSHYPYSAPVEVGGEAVNYLRAPVHAVVDSFSGRVTLYGDDGDPILAAWSAAFPTLFRPAEDMPAQLRAHLRYPRRLFAAQADAYATYHADNATGFWNGADAWQPARQLAGAVEDAGEIHFPDPQERLEADERREGNVTPDQWRSRPDYLLARLPGDRRERFVLATSFTPRGRENLVGYLAGSVDADGSQRLTLLSLPRDRLTVGPTQATREVLASPAVNRRIQLLNRESRDLGRNSVNRTILGIPRMVPLGEALIHVQPIYITAGGSGLPRLQLVTAYANGRVGYGRDLPAAVRSLVEGRPCGAAGAARRRAPAAAGAPTAGCRARPPRIPLRTAAG